MKRAGVLVVAVAVAGACDGRTPIESSATGGGSGDQPELMARWNAAVDVTPSSFDFHWTAFTQFPHPTFEGGTAAAYQAFATVLLAFFQRGDDFDFLARNHLFTLPLVHVSPNGTGELATSFQALATYFASGEAITVIPADTRAALQIYVDRMMGAPADAGSSPPPPPDGAYAAMCRHYCEALHDSNIYGCVQAGRDVATCTQIAPAVEECFQLRCVPQLVTPALCLTQCDGLRGAYDAVCGGADGPS